jgi:hypothetical protein
VRPPTKGLGWYFGGAVGLLVLLLLVMRSPLGRPRDPYNHFENRAMSRLLDLCTAAAMYEEKYHQPPSSLAALQDAGLTGCPTVDGGYRFSVEIGRGAGSAFAVRASPVAPGREEAKHLYYDRTGVFRYAFHAPADEKSTALNPPR